MRRPRIEFLQRPRSSWSSVLALAVSAALFALSFDRWEASRTVASGDGNAVRVEAAAVGSRVDNRVRQDDYPWHVFFLEIQATVGPGIAVFSAINDRDTGDRRVELEADSPIDVLRAVERMNAVPGGSSTWHVSELQSLSQSTRRVRAVVKAEATSGSSYRTQEDLTSSAPGK